jgi:uncharacterized RDD family membrane protein YckC
VSGSELSPVPREARPFQGAPAGLVTRLLANTIDAIVVCLVIAGCYLGWAAFRFILDPLTFTFPRASLLFFVTAGLVVSTVYLGLAWWLAGKSYGGHVMGLRVTGHHGRGLGPVRSFARAGFCAFFPIGLFWCLVSPRRRSVQDIVLWSVVLYDWAPHPTKEAASHVGDAAVDSAPGPARLVAVDPVPDSATPPEPPALGGGPSVPDTASTASTGPTAPTGPSAPTAPSGPSTAEAS